ncbi:MAG: hypothetical protein H0T73_04930 [Ardenticatenales bacterium]|nr:hypothetical protein [Ardenticatenales bacterium]
MRRLLLPLTLGLAPQIGTPPGLLLLTLAAAFALWWALHRPMGLQREAA